MQVLTVFSLSIIYKLFNTLKLKKICICMLLAAYMHDHIYRSTSRIITRTKTQSVVLTWL